MSNKHVKTPEFGRLTTMVPIFFQWVIFENCLDTFEWPLILNKSDNGEPFGSSVLTPSARKPTALKLRGVFILFYWIWLHAVPLPRWLSNNPLFLLKRVHVPFSLRQEYERVADSLEASWAWSAVHSSADPGFEGWIKINKILKEECVINLIKGKDCLVLNPFPSVIVILTLLFTYFLRLVVPNLDILQIFICLRQLGLDKLLQKE